MLSAFPLIKELYDCQTLLDDVSSLYFVNFVTDMKHFFISSDRSVLLNNSGCQSSYAEVDSLFSIIAGTKIH